MAVFAAAAVMSGATWSVIGAHALTGFVALAIGIALFALGLIGGGDAKFFAAISLWMGSDLILKYCLLFAMIGGGFALLVVVLRRVPLPAFTARISMINHLIQPKAGLPYGVALGAAGLLLLTSVPLFQMAVSS
jgi:prepilin peptidase CpaA